MALRILKVLTEEHRMVVERNETLRSSGKYSRDLANYTKILPLTIAMALNIQPVFAEQDNMPPDTSSSTQTTSDSKANDAISSRTVASEMGYEIHEAGASFLPDESGVACFTKTGRYRTDDHGILLTYIRRNPDLYINSSFDTTENKYNIVFGNNYCRYTVTIQREIKVNGRWKLSTMLK